MDFDANIKHLENVLEEEYTEYKKKKQDFYSDSIHWSNNKRKMNGLHTLRKSVNKNRILKFRSFRPSHQTFSQIENIIHNLIQFELDSCFNNFVNIKDINFGDRL